MKKILLFLLIYSVACNNKENTEKDIQVDSVVMLSGGAIDCDDLLRQDTALISQLNDQLATMSQQVNALERANDSCKTKLFLSNYRVERVRYYLNIAIKNPSQDKFLKGWIKRAIQ